MFIGLVISDLWTQVAPPSAPAAILCSQELSGAPSGAVHHLAQAARPSCVLLPIGCAVLIGGSTSVLELLTEAEEADSLT